MNLFDMLVGVYCVWSFFQHARTAYRMKCITALMEEMGRILEIMARERR